MARLKSGTLELRRGAVRYAVVGLGHIAQVAVLPAFRGAAVNSRLAALVSSDATKLSALGRKYGISRLYRDDQLDECLNSGEIDAIYIALPNSLHRGCAVRAARAGIHVLCEKPMEVSEGACRAMIIACHANDVRLMIAYRLHFEAANLEAVKIIQSGKLGDPRVFNSVFTIQVRDRSNIRLKDDLGGGPLWDIGIYCINAARYLFRSEPIEVVAMDASKPERRFKEVPEMVTAMLRYPGERLATFTCSFGASDVAAYDVVGTMGHLRMDPAYEYAEGLGYTLKVGSRSRQKHFKKRDQFAAELIYFSECVRRGKRPEPAGEEGLADVRIISALIKSAASRRPVKLTVRSSDRNPRPGQRIDRPGIRKPKSVHASSPSGD